METEQLSLENKLKINKGDDLWHPLKINNLEKYILDEISLEGLEGITFETLWLRLSTVLNIPLPFSEKAKNVYWNIFHDHQELEFFELPEERRPLVIFNRYDHTDELGVCQEVDDLVDIYGYKCINDVQNGIVGSCKTYETRVNITEVVRNLSLLELEKKYGQKLVIVASQKLRYAVLLQGKSITEMVLSPVQYCILERIGRSREQGEITQGKNSLQIINDDAKHSFYNRKILLQHKLVVKQHHYQKLKNLSMTGSLFHLTRFYAQVRSKTFILIEQLVNLLKSSPNYRIEYEEVRKYFPTEMKYYKKLYKNPELHKFVRTDVQMPYRDIYPNAPITEWKSKANGMEKRIRTLQLIDPNVDVYAEWFAEKPEPDEEEVYDNRFEKANSVLSKPLLNFALECIINSGSEGLSMIEFSKAVGRSHLDCRALAKTVLKKNVCNQLLVDFGKQRKGKMCFRGMGLEISSNQSHKKYEDDEEIDERNFTVADTFYGQYKETVNDDSWKKENTSLEDMYANFANLQERLKEAEHQPLVLPERQIYKRKLADVDRSEENVAKKPKTNIINNELDLNSKQLINKAYEENNAVVRGITTNTVEDSTSYKLEHFFGKQPRVFNISNGGDKVKVKIIVSTEYKAEEKPLAKSKTQKAGITQRKLTRANIIKNFVQEHKIITDIIKVDKIIKEYERKQGYNVTIDKKSYFRLIDQLIKDGYIKAMKVIMSSENLHKSVTILCDIGVELEDSIMKTALEQLKMKFIVINSSKIKPKVSASNSSSAAVEEAKKKEQKNPGLTKIHESLKNEPYNYEYDRNVSKYYGYAPKFVRTRLTHVFIFYLVYELPKDGTVQPLKNNEVQVTTFDEELPPIYNGDGLTWKTFVPPLPRHKGWIEGWTQVTDVLLRIPLNLFIQICHVPYKIPGLKDYLNHPVKKFYLVKDLPSIMVNGLLKERKYVYHIHDNLIRLCYMGLLQFGPQKLKDKDQIFVYVNRKAVLYQTIDSKPSYHKVEKKPYPMLNKTFNSGDDLESYWCELWNICMKTKLGFKTPNKYVVIEKPQYKSDLNKCTESVGIEEAVERDVGQLPGDRLGAAGLDSSLFAHLKRNWRWYNSSVAPENTGKRSSIYGGIRRAHLDNIKPTIIKMNKRNKIHAPRAKQTAKKSEATAVKITLSGNAANKKVIRKLVPHVKQKRKVIYDDVDKVSLLLLKKLRVNWSLAEDNFLLLCKVASIYLLPYPRKRILPFHVVRDILHCLYSDSRNKTSRAVQRRIVYMLKNEKTAHSVQVYFNEIKRNQHVIENFEILRNRMLRNEEVSDELMYGAYVYLLHFLLTYFPCVREPTETSVSRIKHNVDLYRQGHMKLTVVKLKQEIFNEDPKTEKDIEHSVVKNVIHCELCSAGNKTGWSYHFFKVYSKYSETLLRSVVAGLRKEQLLVIRKNYKKKNASVTDSPVQTTPYQLSYSYLFALKPYINFENLMATQAFMTVVKTTEDDRIEINVSETATSIGLAEMNTETEHCFDIHLPKHVLHLDPQLRNKNANMYERIMTRYTDFVSNHPEVLEEVESSESVAAEDTSVVNAINTKKTTNRFADTGNIAFYLQKQEFQDIMDETSSQHFHDYFVLNPTKVDCIFLNRERNSETYSTLDAATCEQLLKNIQQELCVQRFDDIEERLLENFLAHGGNEDSFHVAKILVNYLHARGSMGATAQQMEELLAEETPSVELHTLLKILRQMQVVYRVGISTCYFVHYENVNKWLVNSFKLTRLEREKIDVRRALLDSSSTIQSEFSAKAQRHVNICPWINIDGTVNRRALEIFLNAVLNYCLVKPGISLLALSMKFTYLSPFQVRLLAEYLEYLGCIRLTKIVKINKITLFSKQASLCSAPATGLEDSTDIYIETDPKAMTRFSFFIGYKGPRKEFQFKRK